MTKDLATIMAEKVENQKDQLERINTALEVLLERRDKDKADIFKMVSAEIKKNVFPFIERLTTETLSPTSQTYLAIIKDNLKKIAALNHDYKTISDYALTTTEMHIVELIKQGKQSKEIASALNISTSTVSFHRNNIRIKLGLKNSKKNLFAYLNSIEK